MVYCQRRGADVSLQWKVSFRWSYNPVLQSDFLMGPWRAPDGRLDPKQDRQHAHITRAAGGVYWACIDPNEEPKKFYNLEEAKAYLIAMVRLT